MRLSLSYPCYSNGIMRQLRNSRKHGNTGDNFLRTVLVFGLCYMQQRLTTMEPRSFRSEWEMCFLIQPPLTYSTVAQHGKGDIHTICVAGRIGRGEISFWLLQLHRTSNLSFVFNFCVFKTQILLLFFNFLSCMFCVLTSGNTNFLCEYSSVTTTRNRKTVIKKHLGFLQGLKGLLILALQNSA